MKRRKNPFRGVATVEDRHGKLRYRLRRTIRGRTIDTYLPRAIRQPGMSRCLRAGRRGRPCREAAGEARHHAVPGRGLP